MISEQWSMRVVGLWRREKMGEDGEWRLAEEYGPQPDAVGRF